LPPIHISATVPRPFAVVLPTTSPDHTLDIDHPVSQTFLSAVDEHVSYGYQGTVNYYERVRARMGGARRTEEFARLFLAPGVAHCAGGPGPQPDSPLNALVDRVERGRAPRVPDGVVRDAGGAVTQTRPICLYPEVAAYRGRGDVAAASSFACRRSR
jgi:hypothetical protein